MMERERERLKEKENVPFEIKLLLLFYFIIWSLQLGLSSTITEYADIKALTISMASIDK